MLEEVNKKTDEELIFLSIKDSEYFGEIIDRYERKLKRYIQRLSSLKEEEQDDLTQEVFISIYENLHYFEKNEKFSSWIYRITHNKVVDFWRKNKKRVNEISIDENLDFIESIFNKNDVEDDIQNLENSELLGRLFSTLDIKYREVFVLRYFEEKSYEEISEILKIPKSSVSTLLNRGRKKIKIEYQKIKNKNN